MHAAESPAGLRIGVDVGGTKIEAIALAGSAEIGRIRVPTPQGDYAGTVAAIAQLVRELELQAGETARVGVGIPGMLSRATGRVKNANSVCLIGQPLKEDLEARLAREIRIANDANCFAVSEAADGAAAGAGVVFGVILGTGTGGGVVVHGKVLTGPNAVAGEWGHNSLPWPTADESPGPECYCGSRGCVETFLSGPGLARDFRAATGESVPPEAIVERAERGDAAAGAALERYAGRLARGLASVINVLDPDVIVLGGGLSNILPLYERVPALWTTWVFSDVVDTRLVRARHGASSGVRGAAWLWGEGA